MTLVSLISPYGMAQSNNFVIVGGVRWSPAFSVNVDLIGNDLTVIAKSGAGQGVCVAPEVAQSSGTIYWEVTWTGLLNPALQGGVGLISLDAIAGADTLAEAYDSLALSGAGGIVIRPDGTLFQTVPNGNGVGPSNPPWPLLYHTHDGINHVPLQEGNTVGIAVDFDSAKDAGFLVVTIFVVNGS